MPHSINIYYSNGYKLLQLFYCIYLIPTCIIASRRFHYLCILSIKITVWSSLLLLLIVIEIIVVADAVVVIAVFNALAPSLVLFVVVVDVAIRIGVTGTLIKQ